MRKLKDSRNSDELPDCVCTDRDVILGEDDVEGSDFGGVALDGFRQGRAGAATGVVLGNHTSNGTRSAGRNRRPNPSPHPSPGKSSKTGCDRRSSGRAREAR